MKRLVKTPYYIVDGVTYTEGVREFKEKFDEAWEDFKSKCTPIEIKPSLFQRIKKLLFTSLLLLSFTVYSQDSFKFTTDKQLHALAGAGVGYIVTDIAMGLDKFKDRDAIALGLFFGYVADAGKEVYDLYSKNGTASLEDLSYSFLGTIVGTFSSFGINKWIDHRKKKRELKLKL